MKEKEQTEEIKKNFLKYFWLSKIQYLLVLCRELRPRNTKNANRKQTLRHQL